MFRTKLFLASFSKEFWMQGTVYFSKQMMLTCSQSRAWWIEKSHIKSKFLRDRASAGTAYVILPRCFSATKADWKWILDAEFFTWGCCSGFFLYFARTIMHFAVKSSAHFLAGYGKIIRCSRGAFLSPYILGSNKRAVQNAALWVKEKSP